MSTEMHGAECKCDDPHCPSPRMQVARRCDHCLSIIPKQCDTKLVLVHAEWGSVHSYDLCENCMIMPIVLSDIGKHRPFYLEHEKEAVALVEASWDARGQALYDANPALARAHDEWVARQSEPEA